MREFGGRRPGGHDYVRPVGDDFVDGAAQSPARGSESQESFDADWEL
jgi:hypothetical protein